MQGEGYTRVRELMKIEAERGRGMKGRQFRWGRRSERVKKKREVKKRVKKRCMMIRLRFRKMGEGEEGKRKVREG